MSANKQQGTPHIFFRLLTHTPVLENNIPVEMSWTVDQTLPTHKWSHGGDVGHPRALLYQPSPCPMGDRLCKELLQLEKGGTTFLNLNGTGYKVSFLKLHVRGCSRTSTFAHWWMCCTRRFLGSPFALHSSGLWHHPSSTNKLIFCIFEKHT